LTLTDSCWFAGSIVDHLAAFGNGTGSGNLRPAPAVVAEQQWRNPVMPIERNPNDPYESDRLNNPISPDPYTAEMRSRPPFDEENLRADPELAEGPASSAKIALFAVAIAIVLGAVFYGLNNSSTRPGETTSTAQNAQPASPPAAPAGMRDVTPRGNSAPGMTTGAAPAPTPPAAPSPPASNPPASK
jgi:hypothetical protein